MGQSPLQNSQGGVAEASTETEWQIYFSIYPILLPSLPQGLIPSHWW